ncbi:gamma-aminobutyraldehyde dehydrogenase [Gordonia sp. OPL2]|uniref:gamma-aminobutyraldehyde dehydrogenase n=1 Tax=Gordonia sp. OPL2 TaxID=2486274 RepID=UPI0016550F62|nr:gamma-aminobutyraldehyde dehydrogenase [Gordonia sp. OPL2]ROZ99426.1 gamma-aminobutyraldehyde dehydrogenase [Gordonia sp. OPL2]
MLDTTDYSAKNLINGGLVDAASGELLDVIEPATGEVLARVPASGADDVDAAVTAAEQAFRSFKRTTPGERAEMLLTLAARIEKHAEHLAYLEARNVGKPIPVAREELPLVVDNLRFFAGAARTMEGRAGGEYLRGYESYVRREPIGVVAGIAPWNYPLLMATWKIGPALAAGNCSILKPSRQTPLTALYVAKLAQDIFPAGVFSVISGSASDIGDQLVADPRIGLVSLTGDTSTGRHIARVAADHVAQTHLELGGKAPVIVLDDADLDAAVAGIVAAGFANSGQDCTAACRVIATQGIYDRLLEALIPAVQAIKVGNPTDSDDPDKGDPEMGPLISATHRQSVLDVLAKTDGTIVAGGNALPGDGYFLEPTVVANPSQNDLIVQTEQFGPIVSVQCAADIDQAFEWANDVEFGLASSIWTKDITHSTRAARDLDFGCVWVNDHMPILSEMPHGGFKQSGYGKDMSIYALEEYTRVKHVMTKTD